MEQPICRTCLTKADAPIFQTVILDQNELTLIEMLYDCTGLKVTESDGISLNICEICTEEIIKFYVYRKKCWDSHKFLLQQLEVNKSKVVPKNEVNPINFVEELSNLEEEYEVIQMVSDREEPDNVVSKQTELSTPYMIVDKTLKSRGAVKCPICDKVYSRKSSMLNHRRKVHDTRVEKPPNVKGPVTCHSCDKIYSRRNLMLDHMRLVHNIREYDQFECKLCTKSFKLLKNLQLHIQNIHERGATFMCDHCGQKLKTHRSFIEHVRRHTGEKPYKCDLCEYRAAHRRGLDHHKQTHANVLNFECDICGKSFRTSNIRSSHRRTHSTSNHKPYECIVCLKKFKLKSSYKEHMVIHNIDQHIECKFCGKKFARKDNLNTHIKQHTGEKPHVCEYCGKGFIQKHCWRNHLKNHHKQ